MIKSDITNLTNSDNLIISYSGPSNYFINIQINSDILVTETGNSASKDYLVPLNKYQTGIYFLNILVYDSYGRVYQTKGIILITSPTITSSSGTQSGTSNISSTDNSSSSGSVATNGLILAPILLGIILFVGYKRKLRRN